ncbi:YALIA101S01e26060g1_1 [Yarrowia lipolytica]|nr:YALIA101S01e26060g1_1 [Yarrowia lipolytica]
MDETQELQLVNAVDLRITMAKEDKLGETIGVYLVPLLTKLASKNVSVRQKVVEMCQHINTRIKNTTFKLPVDALVKQFVESDSELIRNFDLMYIEMGIARMGDDKSTLIIPLISSISTLSYNHSKAVFRILLKLLPFMTYPPRGSTEADKFRETLDVNDNDIAYLALRFTDVFNFSATKRTGMTIREYEFLSAEECTTAVKSHLLKFISALFTDTESYIPLLCASTDGSSAIGEPANDAWKKLQVDLESEMLTNQLYQLLLGYNGSSPVKQTTQAKILAALCHSVHAANVDDAFRAIQYFTQTDFYSRAAIIQFVNWIVKHSNEELFLRHSGDLLERVTHLGNDAKTAESAQELMGGILRRDSRLLSNISHVTFLFDRKAGDSLSELINPLAKYPETAEKLIPHLSRYISHQATQFMAAKYATRVFPYSSAHARFLCLVGLTFGRTDMLEECNRGLNPYWMRAVNVPYITSHDSLDVIKGTSDSDIFQFPDVFELCKLIHESKFDLKKAAEWMFPYLVRLTVATAIQGHDTVCVVDEQWETRVDEALKSDDHVRKLVIEYLSKTDISPILDIISTHQTFSTLPEVSLELYYSLVSLSTKSYNVFDANNSVVQLALTSPYYKIQSHAARVIGLEQSEEVAHNLIAQCFNHVPKNVDGPILVFSNLVSFLSESDISSALEICSTHIDMESVQTFLSEMKLHRIFLDNWSRLDDVKKKTLVKPTEHSVLAFAYLNLDSPDFESNVDKIFAIESKQMDFAFFTGEALCVLAAGWETKFVKRKMWKIADKLPVSSLAEERVSQLTTRLINMAKTVTKPSLRKSTAIWLLSVVQYCGHMIHALLPQLQLAFMRFLPEKDDIVQEAASRGLSLVFEQGDSRLQKDLVENLVSSFVTDKSSHNQKVHQETELFEPGVLNTNDGSISTYKDILSLASEVGDPSLVYRFMSLANHASLWSSRKGIAFGLGNIFAKASLEQQLADNPALGNTLIPKLYRYKFDPSTGQVMANIWKMLIGESSTKTVNSHFESILKELLSSISSKEWRVRQASSAALLDLLQGRPISQYLDHLSEIWTACFRVVDDIKESVRTAGLGLTRGLTTALIRSLESDSISDATAKQVLDQIIPFLLGNSGLQSSAEEVQHFSLDVLLQLIKKGGSRLKPFIPDLLSEFVELLSTLEPQAMNYIALNADKYGTTANDIDSSRLAAVRHSPMMDSIEEIIDLCDADLMKKIVPKLTLSIRKSVGLPSKVAGSRIIVTLTIRKTQLFKPYAGPLLVKSAIPSIYDRNETVSRSYLAACGYLCRLADDESVLSYITELQNLYFGEIQKGTLERARISAAIGVKEIAAHAADKFDSLSASLLPLIFVGKHDSDPAVQDVFTNIWNNNTGGKGAISLHIKEIIALVSPHLSSQQWNIKQIAATSIADACNSVGKNVLNDELFEVMISACQGKSWTGKEAVFDALVSLAIKFNLHDAVVDKVVTTEIKRKNREYQILALKSASRYLGHFPSKQLFDIFSDICSLYLLSKSDLEDVDMDSDDEEELLKSQSEDRRNAILGTAIRALSIESTDEDVSFLSSYFSQVSEWIQLALTPPKNLNKLATKKSVDPTWKTKLCISQALYSVVIGFFGQEKPAGFEKQFLEIWTLVADTCLLTTNLDKTKVEVCKLGQAVLNSKMSDASKEKVREVLVLAEEHEQSLIVKAELGRVLKSI